MELWIRSQDKKRLIKTNILELSTYEPNKLILTEEDIGKEDCEIFANEHIYIGTYKTKERALEVLDEIQCFLNGSITKDLYVNGDYCGSWETQRNEIVYEMPKE